MVRKSASLMLEHASGTVDNAKQRDWVYCNRKGQKWRVEPGDGTIVPYVCTMEPKSFWSRIQQLERGEFGMVH